MLCEYSHTKSESLAIMAEIQHFFQGVVYFIGAPCRRRTASSEIFVVCDCRSYALGQSSISLGYILRRREKYFTASLTVPSVRTSFGGGVLLCSSPREYPCSSDQQVLVRCSLTTASLCSRPTVLFIHLSLHSFIHSHSPCYYSTNDLAL